MSEKAFGMWLVFVCFGAIYCWLMSKTPKQGDQPDIVNRWSGL